MFFATFFSTVALGVLIALIPIPALKELVAK